MSEKVVISKELADLIKERLGYGFSKETMIEWHLTNFFGDGRKLNVEEGNISTEDFVKAICIGYTTPATLDTSKFDNLSEAEREKVNKELVELRDSFKDSLLFSYEDGFKDGVNRTLDRLGIKLNEK
ncbi:hypothetical protein [Bacillus altitudinis]|uniref:hypothetical protein n=1 Tax=Bacillus altitudinis TaxID=293387 RepID=UPI0021019E8D|nr:hypothetical protein [Bacillus altitudinis]UTV34902.1 hypothetical protein NM966_19650 [Bacillus altitudinis]